MEDKKDNRSTNKTTTPDFDFDSYWERCTSVGMALNNKAIMSLIMASLILFMIGFYPILDGLLFNNPYAGLGVRIISFPAWVIGAIIGSVLGYNYRSLELANYSMPKLGWGIFLLNVVAIMLYILIRF